MPGIARPTEQKDQVKEHEREKEKKEQKETTSTCGTEKPSCCC